MTKSIDSPTGRLLAGLAVTLAAVGVFSFYALRQIRGLEDLQTRIVDRNRKDSLLLLRIQNDLNQLGIAMRDMLYGDEHYPLAAWKRQFDSWLPARSKLSGNTTWPSCSRSSGLRRAACSTLPRKTAEATIAPRER